ncbi:barstar family protein [Pantoea sp. 1.19]|uniref:barstar family protein n=1 Tax=Pantoea sp. 1.19 TaxID=1925589 RepID=UPI000948A7EF|nr:barstar family protein [Pantoea sp. 1.19]
MQTYTFDFRHLDTMADVYQQCRRDWSLPDTFGDNLDALWDAVTSGMLPLPAEVRLCHLHERADDGTFDDLVALWFDAELALPGELTVMVS